MANITLSVKHQQRYDTASNWITTNPILLVGEIGIEINTGKLKVGNGVTNWNNLTYIGITTDYLNDNYLPKTDPIVKGRLSMIDANSQMTRATVSPRNNNIGANGIMLTHYNSDEGGLLITEDGAYLWNSTDSGSLLKGLDEDLWTSNTGMKKDCTFSNGLMFDFRNNGDLQIKGKLLQNNGTQEPGKTTSLPASSITCTANSALGGYTNLQSVLNYLANVLTGNQTVTKIKANTFDTTT